MRETAKETTDGGVSSSAIVSSKVRSDRATIVTACTPGGAAKVMGMKVRLLCILTGQFLQFRLWSHLFFPHFNYVLFCFFFSRFVVCAVFCARVCAFVCVFLLLFSLTFLLNLGFFFSLSFFFLHSFDYFFFAFFVLSIYSSHFFNFFFVFFFFIFFLLLSVFRCVLASL